jgi:hypothetical protein
MIVTKFPLAAAAAFALVLAAPVSAEEAHGVSVFPGAKHDETTSGVVKKQLGIDAQCFRTDAGVAEVTAFYRKQPGFKVVSEDEGGSMLKKGGVDVTVQRPWMDMKTGDIRKDTLISIVKPKK